jgi:hypothetical protein
MVFRIVDGVVAGVITRVVARVVAGGDEVYQHHSSAQIVAGGHSSLMKGRARSVRMKNSLLFPF